MAESAEQLASAAGASWISDILDDAVADYVMLSGGSQPKNFPAQIKVVPQGLGGPLMNYPAAFQCHRVVGQCQRQIEMVVDDDDGDFLAQSIEGLEQLLDHRRRQALEGFVEQQYPDIA